MLSQDQLKEFKGKLLTRMLELSDEIAVKDNVGACTDELLCNYQYLSLMKDAIFMPDNGLTADEVETLVYRAVSRARLNEVIPISFVLVSDVLFGDTLSNEFLWKEINNIKADVVNIYNILDNLTLAGDIGIDSGNANTIYQD